MGNIKKSKLICKDFIKAITAILLILITSFYAIKIYDTATNLNYKLSWFLMDLQQRRIVELKHNNLYEDGIEGILQDINDKFKLPDKLYISDSFQLDFDKEGTILSFESFLYGKDKNGKLKTFLISYDKNKSNDITIYLNGNVNPSYSENKILQPMIDTVNLIRFKEKISYWINEGEDRFSILYFGKRNWGYNTAGILYMDKSGNELIDTTPSKVIEGYTVSVYVAEKEDKYTPIRVNLINDIENQYGDNLYSNDNNYNTSEDFSKKEEEIKEERSTGYLEDPKNEFYLFDKIGYRLSVIEAALGSRFYVLDKTTNGGVSWEVINKDPFIGEIGVAEGIKFIDSNIGFIILSHSGGSYADIYRTGDGGKNFQKLIIPEISVTLSNNVSYNPFDFPNIPYEEDGCLFMEVGQGSDGDYNGGVKAIYKSIGKGENWSIVCQG